MLIRDYSMIEATRPDPTVRPPSRYQTGILRCANGGFSCNLCGRESKFSSVSMWFWGILLSWCYQGIPLSARKSNTRSLNSSKLDSKQL